MSEVVPPARRRGTGRAPRSAGPTLAPLPRLEVPWSPLEILSAEQVERILVAAWRVLEEAGLEIRSAAARDVYRKAGAAVDDDTQRVRIGRDIVCAQFALAPEQFVLHARNPARTLAHGHEHVDGVQLRPALQLLIGNRSDPSLVIFAHDPLVKPSATRALLARLPGPARYVEVPASHEVLDPAGPAWPQVQAALVEFAGEVLRTGGSEA